jgi:hypothetical protein
MRLGLLNSRMNQLWRNMHHHVHIDDNGRIQLSIVVTSWRRSGLGRRTDRTPLSIDSTVTLFFLVAINLCLDVWLLWKFMDLFCLVATNLADSGPDFCRYELVSRVSEFVCPSCEFVKFWICECVDLLCVDLLCKFVIINLFWLRPITPGVLGTLWTLHVQQSRHKTGLHSSPGLSCARPSDVT